MNSYSLSLVYRRRPRLRARAARREAGTRTFLRAIRLLLYRPLRPLRRPRPRLRAIDDSWRESTRIFQQLIQPMKELNDADDHDHDAYEP
jgi:hypothetical protein